MSEEIVDSLSDVEQAVSRVEYAVGKVEQAVKEKWTTVGFLVAIGIGFLIISLWDSVWYSKWRYSLTYGVPKEKVEFPSDTPHDCAFLAAPLGEKYCHYDRKVETLRWATSTTGNPIASFDEGKTWTVFTPDAGVTVPQHSTVEAVYVSWEKKED